MDCDKLRPQGERHNSVWENHKNTLKVKKRLENEERLMTKRIAHVWSCKNGGSLLCESYICVDLW
jgi:hypothetical protein